jgi:hypothetical protein
MKNREKDERSERITTTEYTDATEEESKPHGCIRMMRKSGSEEGRRVKVPRLLASWFPH